MHTLHTRGDATHPRYTPTLHKHTMGDRLALCGPLSGRVACWVARAAAVASIASAAGSSVHGLMVWSTMYCQSVYRVAES